MLSAKRLSVVFFVILTVCFLMSTALSHAQTNPLYVATYGSDLTGNGTSANPYATINKGAMEATDGDTVIVADGIYVLSEEIKVESKRLFVRSQNGYEACIIDAAGNTGFYLRITDYVSDTAVSLTGLTIQNAATAVYACEATNACIHDSCIKDSSKGVYCEVGGGGADCVRSIFSGNDRAFIIGGDGGGGITDCTITGNREGVGIYSSSLFGIKSSYFSDNDEPINIGWMCTGTISNNLFHQNTRGIATFSAMDVAVYYNTLADNSGPAVRIDGMRGDINVYNNIFWNTASNSEISIVESFEYSGTVEIAHNTVHNGLTAIDKQDPDATVNCLVGNQSADPLFVNPGSDDYQLLDYSPCIGAGTGTLPTWPAVVTDILGTPRGTPPDMGAYENALDIPAQMNIYVATTGSDVTGTGTPANPYATINKGVTEASDGDTVIVADGVYNLAEKVTIDNKSIHIRAQDGYGNCIVDGGGVHDGFFLYCRASYETLSIDGLIIQNTETAIHAMPETYLTISNTKIAASTTGIYCEDGGSGATCTDCVFLNNGLAANIGGDGMGNISQCNFVNNETGVVIPPGSFCTIQNSSFDGNAVAVTHMFNSWCSIAQNIFTNNDIAIQSDGAGTISDNRMTNNGSGIVSQYSDTHFTQNVHILNNTIQNSTGTGFGINTSYMGYAEIINNVISGYEWGIRLSENSSAVLNSNTIVNNQNGILTCTDNCTITNSIFWNAPDGLEMDIHESDTTMNDTFTVDYCDIRDGQDRVSILYNIYNPNLEFIWGDNNIASDPQFVDPASDNYQLLDSSPCIGAGTSDGAPLTDILGMTRGTPPDMGAYENVLDAPVRMNIHVATTGNDESGNGTSAKPFKTIQKGIDTAAEGDTVVVADGVYTGMGNVNLDYNGKAITVKSQNGPQGCIIDCESVPGVIGFYFNDNETNSSIVDGFTICRGNFILSGRGTGGAIDCYNASPTIMNNVICDNISHEGGGIRCFNSSPLIINNAIYNNTALSWGGGVSCESLSSPIIRNNTITRNSPDGITCIISSNATIINSIVRNNEGNNEVMGDATVTISYSNIQGGQAGVHMFGGALNWLNGNISSDPQFVDPASDKYMLLDYSPCIGAGTSDGAPLTDILGMTRGTPPDMGAYENWLNMPIEGVHHIEMAVSLGYIHPYCYRWDGCEYIPIHIGEDGTFEGTWLEPWEGCWIILNNKNINFRDIDILIPRKYATADVPPFVVEPNKHYLFGVPLATAQSDLNASSLGRQLGSDKYENTWRIGKWQWDIEDYHNYNGPDPAFDELMTLRPGKGFWLQQITDDPITIELEGTLPEATYTMPGYTYNGGPYMCYEISLPKNELDEPYTYHMVGNPYGIPALWGEWFVRTPASGEIPTAKVAFDPASIKEWHIDLKLVATGVSARDTYNRAGVVTSGDPDMLRAFDLEPVGEFVRLTVSDPNSQIPEPVAYDYRPDGLSTYTWQINLSTNYETIDTYLSLDNIVDVPGGYMLVLTEERTGESFTVKEDYSLPVTLREGIEQNFTLVATTTPTAVEDLDAPVAFGIRSTMPNPFNPMTTIQYALTEYTDVTVKVYNVNGQMVDTLVDSRMSAGMHSVVWNAQGQASGMYFIALEAGGQRDVTKVMLMK